MLKYSFLVFFQQFISDLHGLLLIADFHPGSNSVVFNFTYTDFLFYFLKRVQRLHKSFIPG